MNQNQTPSQVRPQATQTQRSITWVTPEFQEYRKHPLWFAGAALITALFVLYGIFTNSWTTAVVFGMAGLMAVIYAMQKPQDMTVNISGMGVKLNDKTYSFRDLHKFWIIYSPPDVKVMYLETKSAMHHVVKVELSDQDPVAIRHFLRDYLDEDLDQQESLADIIARKLKF